MEQVEDRVLLAVFEVNSIFDDPDINPGDGICATEVGDCTLRAAIEEANALTGTDRIEFNIGFGGPQTISPSSALPDITDPVVIDGTTQPGFSVLPIIELDGSGVFEFADGLTILAGDSTVQGLVINRFFGAGIFLADQGGNVILGNFIGTDVTGSNDLGNSFEGVRIEDSPGNIIGAPDVLDPFGFLEVLRGNVISGNDSAGILMIGPGATGNVIQANFVGVDFSGFSDLGNDLDGVAIVDAPGNTVGGEEFGAGNTLSGNGDSGVFISGADATGNIIQGNLVGVDFFGFGDLGNGLDGITIVDAPGNTVGGEEFGAGNTLSGNGASGVFISGTGASGNVVLGNFIGTDSTGTISRGNDRNGVTIVDAPGNIIGAPNELADDGLTIIVLRGNVIGGNLRDGILIEGPGATGNLIQGNRIGTDPFDGTLVLKNGRAGVSIIEAPGNTLGGTTPGARNIISGSGFVGVFIAGPGASGNRVIGNYIGTNASGGVDGQNTLQGNQGDGVLIQGAPRNAIGGTEPGAGNLIANNGVNGIDINSPGAVGNVIQGNLIGTDASGNFPLGNNASGVAIFDNPNNTVGGAAPGAGNVISGNQTDGVVLTGPDTTGNFIQGNRIGTDRTGSFAVGNSLDGVVIQDGASGNTVGGATTGERNVIAGNRGNGIGLIFANGNVILGNYIGTNALANAPVPNFLSGVSLTEASGNAIGAPNDLNADGTIRVLRGNVISGNNSAGVQIGASSTNNLVLGNLIGTDAVGTADVGNLNEGVLITSASDNTVGGTDPGSRNVISGNGTNGVSIVSGSTRNVVLGNLIGTDVTSIAALGNVSDGILISSSSGNMVGGITPGARNIISNNAGNGVNIAFTSSGNTVQGNFIGTDSSGFRFAGNGNSGLVISDSANNTVGALNDLNPDGTIRVLRGNLISNNASSGVLISLRGATGNVVLGNLIGTDVTGNLDLGNRSDGVTISDSPNNLIGGSAPGARNLISGNNANGVNITLGVTGGVTSNVVMGNFIGTNITGAVPLGNAANGVFILGAPGNTIAANVISANGLVGVNITGPTAAGNRVLSNRIGTAAAGTTALGNLNNGVVVANAGFNVIGEPGAGNVISANQGVGIQVLGRGATGNRVQANFIGTDATGTGRLGNALSGVLIDDASDNVVGGGEAATRNLIAANDGDGVRIQSPNALRNQVVGNRIGTDLGGALPLGNTGNGVRIENASQVLVAFNLISANAANGVALIATTGNTVRGNLIGTDGSGSRALGNAGSGVAITGATSNTIGGPEPASRNVISGNLGDGVTLSGVGATGNAVLGNFVGTDSSGTRPLGNAGDGIRVVNAPGNLIGGTTAGARNVLSANAAAGIELFGDVTRGITVTGNFIGTDVSGMLALGNEFGVFLNDAVGNAIGSEAPGAGNVISGNRGVGIQIFRVSETPGGNTIQGNLIGTDASGTGALGNGTGIFLNNAPQNLIGGTTPLARNVISGNDVAGVHIFGARATGNVVQGNVIGPDVTGTRVITTAGGDGFARENRQDVGVLINEAPGNFVGGGNVLAGNIAGVEIVGAGATGNVVVGNSIGIDPGPDGQPGTGDDRPLGNLIGVFINGASGNTIGRPGPGLGNLISRNISIGVSIVGNLATGNVVQANTIDANRGTIGGAAVGVGVYIERARNNTIGAFAARQGGRPEQGNSISNNRLVGAYLFDGADGNAFRRNVIRGNGQYGVLVFNAAGNVDDIARRGADRNIITGSDIATFREFTGPVSQGPGVQVPRGPRRRNRRGPGRLSGSIPPPPSLGL